MQIPDEKEPESCVEVFIESMLSWCCSKKIFAYKHCSSILDCDLEIEEPEVIIPSITKLEYSGSIIEIGFIFVGDLTLKIILPDPLG